MCYRIKIIPSALIMAELQQFKNDQDINDDSRIVKKFKNVSL